MINPTASDVGRRVTYIGNHGGPPEHGTISSFNENYVFVRYSSGSTGAATNREDLIWFSDTEWKPYKQMPPTCPTRKENMIKKIWKFELPRVRQEVIHNIPDFSRLIYTDGDHIWLEVDPLAETHKLRFFVIGTGHDIDPEASYMATYKQGFFVWHIYSKPEITNEAG